MTKKLTVCLAIIILVSSVFAALSFAQVDPEKALVGRWAGSGASPLVINSVKPTGNDEWVGYASQREGNIEIDILKKDSEIYLEWITRVPINVGSGGPYGPTPVHMKMTGDNKMEGTADGFRTAHSFGGMPGHVVPPRRVTLEKVKAGEVK